MPFHSVSFLFFFALVIVLYFSIPYRFRWALLLIASYIFYMSLNPAYVVLIMILTLTSYYAGLQMGKTEIKSHRKRFLIFAVLVNIGFLFTFKYYDFFNSSFKIFLIDYHLPYEMPALHFILPVGISFYTFKSLSYTMDVYRGDQSPEKHLGHFALYVAFFPQLLAGPIERATRFLPQLYEKFDFDYQRVTNGLKLMLWGFFQKIVIADNLAVLVDPVYNQPTRYQGLPLIFATFFFAFQIYCDFSGYSDIAIGAAQVLGIRTIENFNRPYFSKSIPEFWRRWHISLSTWFRDYLYIPMGGNRVSLPGWCFNLFVVMLICGFWHGANWTFMIWGGLHGAYLVSSVITRGLRNRTISSIGLDRMPRLHNYFKVLITFSMVCFAWIFFRANSVSDALYIVSHLFKGWENLLQLNELKSLFWGSLKFEFMTGIVCIGILIFTESFRRERSILQHLAQKPIWLRWAVYYTMVLGIVLFGRVGERQFIYFQF